MLPAGDGGAGIGCAALAAAGKKYALCEDFESYAAGPVAAPWSLFKGYGAGSPSDVVFANDAAHSGTRSLKSDSSQRGASRARRGLGSLPAALQSTHWGRIFYKNAMPMPTNFDHVTYGALTGARGEVRIVDTVENTSRPNMHQWLYNLPSDSCCAGSAYNWGYDSNWHCAEWSIDATTSSFKFFSDSMQVTSISFTNRGGANMSMPFTDVILGSTSYQGPNGPWIMWIDDLAISDTQIGCSAGTY
jgi:hypothetical protein